MYYTLIIKVVFKFIIYKFGTIIGFIDPNRINYHRFFFYPLFGAYIGIENVFLDDNTSTSKYFDLERRKVIIYLLLFNIVLGFIGPTILEVIR
jgi:hypothetical protein